MFFYYLFLTSLIYVNDVGKNSLETRGKLTSSHGLW